MKRSTKPQSEAFLQKSSLQGSFKANRKQSSTKKCRCTGCEMEKCCCQMPYKK